jgi:hypothetical protein
MLARADENHNLTLVLTPEEAAVLQLGAFTLLSAGPLIGFPEYLEPVAEALMFSVFNVDEDVMVRTQGDIALREHMGHDHTEEELQDLALHARQTATKAYAHNRARIAGLN